MAGMGQDQPREWAGSDIRNLIQQEVSGGQTMVVLNSAISSGELNTAVRSIARDAYTSFESHAIRVTEMAAEMATAKAQIDSILKDCQAFVQETRDEANSANAAMLLETNALHEKQQAIVKCVDGVPNTVEPSFKVVCENAQSRRLSSTLDLCAGSHLSLQMKFRVANSQSCLGETAVILQGLTHRI